MAIPVLICAHPDKFYQDSHQFLAAYPPDAGTFFLPRSIPEGQQPGENLAFLGWADPSETSPIPRHELLEEPEFGIRWGRITAAVALFEWADSPWGDQIPRLDGMWLGKLMANQDFSLCMTTLEASDFPSAAEAARAMLAASRPNFLRNGNPNASYFFLSEVAHKRANLEGQRFRHMCNRACPEHRGWRVV